MSRLLSRRLLSWLAPGLLVLVACIQLALVRTHDLTAWKGGGFGMFSTLDSPVARTLRVVLLTTEGEALVLFPSVEVRRARLLNMPDTELLTDLAAQTVREDWLVYTRDQLVEIESELSEEIRRQLARTERDRREALAEDSTAALPEPYPRLVAFSRARRLVRFEDVGAEVVGARAEVWRFRFDTDEDRLHAEVVNSATVEAER